MALTLNAKQVLYNRRPGHDKVYVVTMWVDAASGEYEVVSYYGKRREYVNAGGAFNALRRTSPETMYSPSRAYRAFDSIVIDKIRNKGYTTNPDGVSEAFRVSAAQLVTITGEQRNAGVSPADIITTQIAQAMAVDIDREILGNPPVQPVAKTRKRKRLLEI